MGDFMKRSCFCNTDTNNNPSKGSFLCNFGYVDYIVLASTIAITLGEELSANDLNVLATFLDVLSDELALIAAVEACPQNNNDNDSDDFVFVPPSIAMTCSKNSKKRTVINKKKIKKRKDT